MNRIATAEDLKSGYIKEGDLIIDAPTKIYPDGSKEVLYYFMPKQWPALREGCTIWINGETLGYCSLIKFNNTAQDLTPWHISSATIKNIPHTKVECAQLVCHGLKNLTIDGVSETFKGLDGLNSNKFLTGNFGFHIRQKMFSGHGIAVSVLDGGSIEIKGFEVQYGFCGIRINGGDYDVTVDSVEISNGYIHDTGEGEGLYLGATHNPPVAKLNNLSISNLVIARTAAEAIQVQHLTGHSKIHNITAYAADVRWLNEFQNYQDTGIQWVLGSGKHVLDSIILDGYGSVGLHIFGSDQTPTRQGLDWASITNVLFNDGAGVGINIHGSTTKGMLWMFKDIIFRSFSNEYYEGTGIAKKDFVISKHNGTDTITFDNITTDSTKSKIFESLDKISITNAEHGATHLEAPEYVLTGFEGDTKKPKHWHQYYGGYFPASKSGTVKIRTVWKAGDVAIDCYDYHYCFYKCVQDHAAMVAPRESNFWIKLTWDENGIRSDREGWNSNAKQSYIPPDNFRLKADSMYKKLEMGIMVEEPVLKEVIYGKMRITTTPCGEYVSYLW